MSSGTTTSDYKSTWTDSAVSNACSSTVWSDLVKCINVGISKSLTDEGFRRFAELSEQEQAVIVEREIFKLQQSENSNLQNFRGHLNRAVDDELIRHIKLMSSNNSSPYHSSNVQQLVEVTSQAIKEILETSPPEMKNTLVLFLNRYFAEYSSRQKASTVKAVIFDFLQCINLPLPSTMTPTDSTTASTFNRHISKNRNTSGTTGNIETNNNNNNMNVTNIQAKMEEERDSFEISDQLFFLLIPLSISKLSLSPSATAPIGRQQYPQSIATNSKEGRNDIKRPSQPRSTSNNNNSYEDMLLQLLYAICGTRHLDLLQESGGISDRKKLQTEATEENAGVGSGSGSGRKGDATTSPPFLFSSRQGQGQGRGYEQNITSSEVGDEDPGDNGVKEIITGLKCYSPCLSRTQAILASKSSELTLHLKTLRHVTTRTTSAADNRNGTSSCPSPSKTFDIHSDSQNHPPSLIYNNFESFLNRCLLRGLSGLLTADTTCFVWDQCFLTSFNAMLPLVLVSLLLENQEELLALELLSSAIDSFESFCRCITVLRLQGLLIKYFDDELKGWLNNLTGTLVTGNITTAGLLGGGGGNEGSLHDIIHGIYPALLPQPPPLHSYVPSVVPTESASSLSSPSSADSYDINPTSILVVSPESQEGGGDYTFPLPVIPPVTSNRSNNNNNNNNTNNNNNSHSLAEEAVTSSHLSMETSLLPSEKSHEHIDTFKQLLPLDTDSGIINSSSSGVIQDNIALSSTPLLDREHQVMNSSTTIIDSDTLLPFTENPYPPLSVASPTPLSLTTMPADGADISAPTPLPLTIPVLSSHDVDKNSIDMTKVNEVGTSGVGVLSSSKTQMTVTPAGTKTTTTGAGLFNMFKRK